MKVNCIVLFVFVEKCSYKIIDRSRSKLSIFPGVGYSISDIMSLDIIHSLLGHGVKNQYFFRKRIMGNKIFFLIFILFSVNIPVGVNRLLKQLWTNKSINIYFSVWPIKCA